MLELSLGLLVLVKVTFEAKDFGLIPEERNLLPKLNLTTVMATKSALAS